MMIELMMITKVKTASLLGIMICTLEDGQGIGRI